MEKLEFENVNDAQLYFVRQLMESGQPVETRGFKTLELSPVFFSVTNPRKRITTLSGRNWNFAAALGELSWHLATSNEVDFIANYLSGWKNYSEDNKRITGSCYGKRIFEADKNGRNKWADIIDLLRNDIHSRRAVISLLDSEIHINASVSDISCTVSLQFLVRNGKIDLIVNMRSNDIIWGLPYDFFFFSYLQELMSFELNMPIGTYYHLAGSMHIYERHYEMANRIISSNTSFNDLQMPVMPSNDIQEFLDAEYKIRTAQADLQYIEAMNIDVYWKELLEVLYYYNQKKTRSISESDTKLIKQNQYFEVI
jgi:thymidylate synthase